VAEGVAVRAYEHVGVVRLHLPAVEAADVVPPTIGLVRADPADASCSIVEIGGDLDWVARYLAGIRAPFDVLAPPALRDELRVVAERLLARCG
jgi:predicted DNA-binding transcriptional regulator YafY